MIDEMSFTEVAFWSIVGVYCFAKVVVFLTEVFGPH